MNKFGSFFALVAFTLAVTHAQDDSAPSPPAPSAPASDGGDMSLIPFVSNLCSNGCPLVCQAMNIFCIDPPGVDVCDALLTTCTAACDQTCQCVDKCGDDCDTFESNCAALGIPIISNVFCPAQGGFCDVSCLALCPQRTMLTIMQNVARQMASTVQQLVTAILAYVPMLQG